MIITIDGPAGSGKSTVARKLAAHLQVAYLDTGAMYRALALTALQRGMDLQDDEKVGQLARSVSLEIDCGPTHARIRVDGHDVSEAIRTIEVSQATSQIAGRQSVRDHLVEMQRRIGGNLGSLVTEGRDQGSVVFPHADFRFVLDGSIKIRANRRYQDMVADGEDVTLADVEANIRSRDAIDAKQWEPLLRSKNVIVIDTTDMSIGQVVNRLQDVVRTADGSPNTSE